MRTLFDEDRATLRDAIEQTRRSLLEYGPRYDHWAIAFSGGKDSSVAATLVVHLVEAGCVPPPKSISVLYADTRMELPPLQVSAESMLHVFRTKGHAARTVLPELDDRFFVYMLGRGVPPPKNRFRWCTPQLKVEPMQRAVKDLRDRSGQKLLMITGVRVGESAARDGRIALSCSKDGSECGQGWFQTSTPSSIADTLAPILHWRVCHVWDWLTEHAPSHGWITTHMIAEAYGGQNDLESLADLNARTGCVGCPLASREQALDRVLRLPQWRYLAPLKRLKPFYVDLQQHKNRIRKANDETRADGTPVKNPGRIGPLKLEARLWGLDQVLGIQADVNADATRLGRPPISLVNTEEEARIRELIASNTWPNRWTGDEASGDDDQEDVYADGTVQPIFGF